MTNTPHVATLSITPEATNLVAAGEAVFKSLTGQEMSDNQQKVSDGITKIVDGLMPSLEKTIKRFTLSNVIEGSTQLLNGLALVITGSKTRNDQKVVTIAPTEQEQETNASAVEALTS